MDNWAKVHVWVGNIHATCVDGYVDDEVFWRYFELDENMDVDIDDSEYKVCQFCKDIGERWYDHDFLGIYFPKEFPQSVPVGELLDELTVSEEILGEIEKICVGKGLQKVNVIFYYHSSEISVEDTDKLYNGLHYIGAFETDFAD